MGFLIKKRRAEKNLEPLFVKTIKGVYRMETGILSGVKAHTHEIEVEKQIMSYFSEAQSVSLLVF
jgi:ferritin-like metal-binding protein YciE